jgi:hypothetical protein
MFNRTSEQNQKPNYMASLDAWLDDNVISKLSAAFEQYAIDADEGRTQAEAAAKVDPVVEEVKKAIKGKILESYHNGKEATAPKDRAKRFFKKS